MHRSIRRLNDPARASAVSHLRTMPTELLSRDLVHAVDAIELPPLGSAVDRGAVGTIDGTSLAG